MAYYSSKPFSIDIFANDRFILPKKEETVQKIELHVFCDASEKAYDAVVNAVIQCQNDKSSQVLTSYTRVAPLKSLSLPRLEFCASVLDTKLLKTVKKILAVFFDDDISLHGWTDSTPVLSWLSKPAFTWKTFIRNRIAYIQSLLPFNQGNHVRSDQNPADLCSRGITATKLKSDRLWWPGQNWLIDRTRWPIQQPFPIDDSNINTSFCQLVQKQLPFEPETLHSFRKLVSVFCHVYSFFKFL